MLKVDHLCLDWTKLFHLCDILCDRELVDSYSIIYVYVLKYLCEIVEVEIFCFPPLSKCLSEGRGWGVCDFVAK